MSYKTILAALIMSFWIFPVFAAESSTNTTTLSASSFISPGHYYSYVLPSFNKDMSTHIQDTVSALSGVNKVAARAEDSTIHFTVKNGARVRLSDLQETIAKVDTDAVVSNPILETSMAEGL